MIARGGTAGGFVPGTDKIRPLIQRGRGVVTFRAEDSRQAVVMLCLTNSKRGPVGREVAVRGVSGWFRSVDVERQVASGVRAKWVRFGKRGSEDDPGRNGFVPAVPDAAEMGRRASEMASFRRVGSALANWVRFVQPRRAAPEMGSFRPGRFVAPENGFVSPNAGASPEMGSFRPTRGPHPKWVRFAVRVGATDADVGPGRVAPGMGSFRRIVRTRCRRGCGRWRRG